MANEELELTNHDQIKNSGEVVQGKKERVEGKWFRIWKQYAANTTLHGPNHITSATTKWKIYYIIIIFLLSGLFFAHISFLIYQYLQFPINIDVKFQKLYYSYPDVTMCPNSGSSSFLINKSEQAESLYKSIHSLWKSATVNRESTEKLTKRSYLKHFYTYSSLIGRLPHHHILWCQINDQSCIGNIIITEHPTYYRCFTLRPRPRSVLAGPTHGITLLLHRGDPSMPILQVNEQYSFEEQASINNETMKSHSGFIIGFHEQGSFPNFQLTALPAVVEVKFGDRLRISLDLTSLQSADLKTRPCRMTSGVEPIKLMKLDKISSSNVGSGSDSLKFSYIRQSCIAEKRQEIIYNHCRCFSEEYSIPYNMSLHKINWCFDVQDPKRIEKTVLCVNKFNTMTENDVLFTYNDTSKSTLNTFLVCPLRCDRFIHLIHSVFKDKIPHSIPLADFTNYFEYLKLKELTNPFLNASSIVSSNDVIVLDISAVSENVNEVVETPAFNIISLLSQIGGVSGMYVGVTFFTVFEVLDLIISWTCALFKMCYSWLISCKGRRSTKKGNAYNNDSD